LSGLWLLARNQFSGLNTVVDVSICRNFLPIDNANSIAELTSFLNLFRDCFMLINYLFSTGYAYVGKIRQTLPATRFGREIQAFSLSELAFPASEELFRKPLEIWRRSAFPSRQFCDAILHATKAFHADARTCA
jgi:hypothetical protein